MKKFIAAAAGLMLAGTMVSTACAAIEVSGDARVRYYYQDNYVNLTDTDDTHWDSRFRMKLKATTESGTYGQAQLKWDANTWGKDAEALEFDHAYFGVPMGPVKVVFGNIPTHVTAMVANDVTRDSAIINYADDMNDVKFIFEVQAENDPTLGTSDEDVQNYILRYELTNDMINVVAAGVYKNDETDVSADGFSGTVRVAQDFGAVNYSADFAYIEEDLTGTDGAGYMGYATVGVPTGEAGAITFVGGFTADGAVMDAPVGFTMIAGDGHLTPDVTSNVGQLSLVTVPTGEVDAVTGDAITEDVDIAVDTWFLGLKAGYQVGEKSTVSGTVAYADMDHDTYSSAWELGAKYAYALTADTSMYAILGYMDVDGADDSQFGAGFGVDVSF